MTAALFHPLPHPNVLAAGPLRSPRRATLAGLTVLVMVGHFFALGGSLSGWASLFADQPGSAMLGMPNTATTTDAAAGASATPKQPRPVSSSLVRWIRPAPPPPPPEPVVVAVKPKPKPKAETKPPKAVEEPPVSSAGVVPLPEPEVQPATPDTTTAAAEPESNSTPPEPAPATEPVEPTTATVPPEQPSTELASGTPAAESALARSFRETGTATLPAATPPPSMRLSYKMEALEKDTPWYGSALLSWSQNGQRYEAKLEAKVPFFGTVNTQTSDGNLQPYGLEPTVYRETKRRGPRATHFEPEAGRVRFSSNAPTVPYKAGIQDRISTSLQLAALLNARPNAYPPNTVVQLPVTGTSTAELWDFLVGADETLNLPAGTLLTRKVTRSPRGERDMTVEIWLAPQLAHMPARMRFTQSNGNVADFMLDTMPR